jgi:tetratricopeptide (TPR) repeat protein
MPRISNHAVWGGPLAALALLGAVLCLPVQAAAQDRTVRADIGQRLLALIELERQDDWSAAIAGYGQLLDRAALTAFERATILTLRGRSWYEAGQADRAIQDWRTAIALDSLADQETNALRLNTGQLLMASGQVREGLEMIEAAIAAGTPVNSALAFRLAQGYGQVAYYRAGLSYARQALELAAPPDRRHYTLLLFFYQQLDQTQDELALVEQIVHLWPTEKGNWSGYAAILAREGREEDAFGVNCIMYLNGMLTESSELVRLARYYSFHGYPYRGAVMLERELNAGRVESGAANFSLLANLWRQAREWDRALPVLQRAATTTGAGPDYERLGEALYQSGSFPEAEAILQQALRRGALARPGDTWTLIGNARVEQDNLAGAVDAFHEALAWDYSRAGAQGWIDYIERKMAVMASAESLPRRVAIEECRLLIEEMRRTVPTAQDPGYDPDGRRLFALPGRCTTYFDVYGLLLPRYERA